MTMAAPVNNVLTKAMEIKNLVRNFIRLNYPTTNLVPHSWAGTVVTQLGANSGHNSSHGSNQDIVQATGILFSTAGELCRIAGCVCVTFSQFCACFLPSPVRAPHRRMAV